MFAVNKVDDIEDNNKLTKKYKKLSKTEKLSNSEDSKSKKWSKSQKLAKSRKKLLKSRNLPNFNAKKNGPSFLTPDTRTVFNYLWLAFTKLQFFNILI